MTNPDDTAPPVRTGNEPGLVIELSHADPAAANAARPKPVEGTVLSASDTSKVLARLPKMPADPDDTKDFAMRERSLPPPRTGATVLGAFPPSKSSKPTTPKITGPLEVVRFAPEGDVPLAPHLSVTFNHPMVEITSLEELGKADVPVTLTPTPKGKWRWVGAKTLMFEPDVRFPMATKYDVAIAKGTKSKVGTSTSKATTFSFTTPPPTVETFVPQGGPVRLQPVIFVGFDQRIDREAVAKTMKLEAGRKDFAVRLATDAEVDGDELAKQLSAQAEKGRWLAVVPTKPLPGDTDVKMTIGPGTPSAEGPRKTTSPTTWSMRTYGPMKVTEHRCGYEGQCPPGTPFEIVFSNPIEAKKFDKKMVTTSPAIPDMTVEVYGDRMYVGGRTKGRTKYEVKLAAEIPDAFGQRLGKSKSIDFKVTEAPESLWAQGQGMTVLDPAGGPRLSVFSVNHRKLKVRAWQVSPSDWRAWLKALEKQSNDSRDLKPPGKKIIDDVIDVKKDDDAIVETAVDLSKALSGGLGHAIVVVEPTKAPKEPWMQQRVITWVQATKIGLSAHVDDDEMLVWTSVLADGKPNSGVEVELGGGIKGKSDARGLTELVLPKTAAPMIIARSGKDVAFLPENFWWWNEDGSWKKNSRRDEVRWYVFDDRHLYKPGEEVKLKGWIRTVDPREGGDLGGLAAVGKPQKVKFSLRDSVGNEIDKGTIALGPFGGFDTTFKLPKTMNLGSAQLELSLATTPKEAPGWQTWHSFEVQEFRRPEYEVSASLNEGPHLVGGHAIAKVEAKYYAGGALPNAEVSWQVTSMPGYYQPPGHDGWIFGKYEPWWCFWRWWGGYEQDPADQPKTSSFSATTDGGGVHELRMDFVSVNPARPMSVSAQATVMDVNRQAWTSGTSTVVHPATTYVGLKSERAFVQAGEQLELDAIAVDIDGKPVTGAPIHIRVVRLTWEQVAGKLEEKENDPQTCDEKAAADPVRCTFTAKEGGSYKIVATTTDAKGRENRTEMQTWVAGGELPAPRDISQEQVLLIPDKESYAAGETAKIAVSAPWPNAEGLVTLRRSGIVEARRVKLDGNSTVVEVKITEPMTPMMHVQVDLAGAAPRRNDDGKLDKKLPKRVAFASGNVSLSIPPRARTLALKVAPAVGKIEPGGKTTIAVDVKDSSGKAVGDAEVALVVVDEAVLALTGYKLSDPLSVFYGYREPGARDHYLRANVLLASTTELTTGLGGVAGGMPGGAKAADASRAEAPAAPPAPPAEPAPVVAAKPAKQKNGNERDSRGGEESPIAMRTNFDALALFSPSVRTDAKGHAEVPLPLPDNLTRYRIMAVAVEGDKQFGLGESAITARLPLMMRPSAPRFLNFGDKLELPVVVQNQTDAAMTVDIGVRAHNATLTKGGGRRVTVPANDRVEVRFPAAAEYAGVARFQVGALSGKWADAAQFELPVWTPATSEAFATYGEIDKGAIAQPVKMPAGVFEQFGGLEITTSSTALQALTDAVLYLVAYPFECSEQIASRVLAIASLRDVLDAFQAEGLPPAKQLVAAVDRDLEKLSRMQTDDGGFSFWGRGWPSWPYLTVHVLHALERAKIKGFKVPDKMLARAQGYVREIEKHLPSEYSIEAKRVIRAYALYVLDVGGKPDVKKAHALLDEAGLEKLPLEGIAWLLPTFAGDAGSKKTVAQIHRHLGNKVAETAADAHFVTSYSDGAQLLLHSDRRVDALVLEGMVVSDPKSDLIPKLVRGLLDHRTAGRWSSTQENGFVLVALDRYFGVFEKTTPDFVAKAWLGEQFAGDHKFKGRTTEYSHIDIPMSWLADSKAKSGADLVLAKEGKGRMYYRVGMRYAPRDLMLDPLDAGFAVERSYEPIDDDGDVKRDKDGTWRIKAGARVRVRLKMVAESRRYHVALVDPLPAGLEPVNPVLA
ncbi:MAG TPA: alpha-2-macroglobulin family protein, partial [Nannocystaceae bacterium]|nr:alpha-2-macroglobulin family protein [Nannocystaceae bacterium]